MRGSSTAVRGEASPRQLARRLLLTNTTLLPVEVPQLCNIIRLWREMRDENSTTVFAHEVCPGRALQHRYAPEVGRLVWGIWKKNTWERTADSKEQRIFVWDIHGFTQALSTMEAGQELRSCAFSWPGLVGPFQLQFNPKGCHSQGSSSREGCAALFLCAPAGTQLTYRFVASRSDEPDTLLELTAGRAQSWESAVGWGDHDACELGQLLKLAGHHDVLTLGVVVTDVVSPVGGEREESLVAYLDLDNSGSSVPIGASLPWCVMGSDIARSPVRLDLRPVRVEADADLVTEELSAGSREDLVETLHQSAIARRGVHIPAHLVAPLLHSLQRDPRDPRALEFLLEKDLRKAFLGREELKQQLRNFCREAQLSREMQNRGLTGERRHPGRHMALVGNPGTGKTMIARVLGKIMKALGLLSRGHVVEVQRGNLVAEHVGATALKTRQQIEKATGGVLFVDEAYRLVQTTQKSNDFGVEALEELMSVMDCAQDLLIILAGYPDEMRTLMEANPGLKRRVYRTIYLSDYTPHELALIFEDKVSAAGFRLERGMDATSILTLIEHECPSGLISKYNGALCERLLNECMKEIANRVDFRSASNVALTTFTMEDVRRAAQAVVSAH